MAHFHKVKVTSKEFSPDNLIRKTIINKKEKIITICQNKLSEKIYTEEEQKTVELLKTWVTEEEIDFIVKVISAYEQQPLVFSHNDLLANNVLLLKSNGRAVFIDY